MDGVDSGLVDEGIELFRWLAENFGLYGALTATFIFFLLFMHYRTQKRLIDQMDSEIKRLAADNRAYREKYLPSIGFRPLEPGTAEPETDTGEDQDES